MHDKHLRLHVSSRLSLAPCLPIFFHPIHDIQVSSETCTFIFSLFHTRLLFIINIYTPYTCLDVRPSPCPSGHSNHMTRESRAHSAASHDTFESRLTSRDQFAVRRHCASQASSIQQVYTEQLHAIHTVSNTQRV